MTELSYKNADTSGPAGLPFILPQKSHSAKLEPMDAPLVILKEAEYCRAGRFFIPLLTERTFDVSSLRSRTLISGPEPSQGTWRHLQYLSGGQAWAKI